MNRIKLALCAAMTVACSASFFVLAQLPELPTTPAPATFAAPPTPATFVSPAPRRVVPPARNRPFPVPDEPVQVSPGGSMLPPGSSLIPPEPGLETLINRLQEIRKQQATLAEQERAVIEGIRKKRAEQDERLEKLGVSKEDKVSKAPAELKKNIFENERKLHSLYQDMKKLRDIGEQNPNDMGVAKQYAAMRKSEDNLYYQIKKDKSDLADIEAANPESTAK